VKFGGPLPWAGPLSTPENMLRIAQEVETLGYEWVWAGEHLLYPKHIATPHPRSGTLPIDPSSNSHEMFTLFSWLAAQTSSLRFMSAMLVVPYHSPFLTAKLVAGLDFLSGGRFTLGAAVGWLREEFDALGLPFEQRGRMTDEYLEIMRALFEGEAAYEGAYFSFPDSWFSPRPIQRPLPVVIGGKPVPAVLKRVARFGQGWWPWPLNPDEIRAALPSMQRAWEQAGRTSALQLYTSGRLGPVQDGGDGPRKDRAINMVTSFAKAGVTHMTLSFGELGGPTGNRSAEEVLDDIRWFADVVMPEVADV
jgi:probable F420-dependent oxidoreductase